MYEKGGGNHNGDTHTWVKILVPILSAISLTLGGLEIRDYTTGQARHTSPEAIEACRAVNELRQTMREIILFAQALSDNPDSPFFERAFTQLKDAECNNN